MGEGAIVRIIGLTKVYTELKAVDDISFHVMPGEIVGLLGPNGAGKTTTINMVLGILEPTSGLIEILGQDLRKCGSEVRKKINFAAVYAHMPANLTVWQNLYIFGLLYEIRDLKKRIPSLMEEFDLTGFARTKAGLLSSGEMSRLNLAKAIINEPRLLLLDEPAAGMNPAEIVTLMELIHFIRDRFDLTILLIEHQMRVVMGICEYISVMDFCEVIARGTPIEIQENQRVVEAYLGKGAAANAA